MSAKTSKIVVIYKSKYGSTKSYAEWISKDVGGDLFESSMVSVNDLQKYQVIVFGGSLHAVGINGVKLITDNFDLLKNKKIIVFGTGASPVREETVKHVYKHNFPNEIQEKIHFFLLRGAFNYCKLSFIDKMLMNALRLMLKMKKADKLDEDSRGLLECFNKPVDWRDKKAIIPIVQCINEE
ncbi:flavodoxin domain-containing protein [Bacillota bacterium LX-D]|nr:flavodoxin domain-containing protein [Bacillota bacterium LX-D]